MGRTSVKNGGPSRKGEKWKTRETKESQNRYSRSRQIENRKRSENRKVANIELSKEGLYTCGNCHKVKPEQDFIQRVPTSGKLSRYECCKQCLNGWNGGRLASGVTQFMRDRNRTRSISTQRVIKANLKDKPGFEEYEAECDAANPPKKASRIRCTQKEMEETLPLVGHGLVQFILSRCFF